MNMSPGVKQIIETLRPYRTEAMIDYVSLKQISKFITRIENRSRSKNIKQDVKLIRTLIKPMMVSAEEKEKRDIIAMRHWHGPHYKRDMDEWIDE